MCHCFSFLKISVFMIKLLRTSVVFIVALFLISFEGNATHIMGGNITYNCIGQNASGGDSILIRLSLYRDCTGATLGTSQSVTIEGSCISTMNVTASLIAGSGNDITPLCPGWPSPCNDPNSQLPVGVEEYIYEVIVVIPAGTNCVLTMSWDGCCRNSDITNGMNDEAFYIYTDYDPSASDCNNSPQFLNVPVPYICTGLPFSYNHGVFDPDGDSLVFSLSPCHLNDKNSVVTYNPTLGPLQPLYTNGPINIDSRTGSITFTPSIQQIGVICVRVEEYDRASKQKIGEITRDIQIIVTNCNNQPPSASGFGGSAKYDTAICPGQGVSFDIFSNDSTPFQTVHMQWNGGIPGGTFTTTTGQYPTGNFSWNPTTSDIGFHFFTVTVIDDGCPITSQRTYSYSVEVRNPIIDLGPDLTVCDGDTVGVNPYESVDFSSYTWSPTTGIIGPTNIPNPIFSPASTTTYTVSATNGFCSDDDVITINVDAKPTVNPPTGNVVCAGESIDLTVTGNAATYQWSNNQTGSTISVQPTQTTTYTVTGISSFGCEQDAPVTVTVNPIPAVDAGPDITICANEPANLSATGDGNLFSWEPAASVTSPNTATTLTNIGVTGTFVVTNTDANGCENKDTVEVTAVPLPSIGAFPDTAINLGEVVTLATGNANAVSYTWSPDEGLQPPSTISDAEIQVSPSKTTTYTVEIVDANGCRSIDSVIVILNPGEVQLPNAFTPNNDGLNDELYLLGEGLIEVNFFRVYNRWGQLVFEGNGVGKGTGWDGTYKGKEQDPGVYTFVYQILDPETKEPKDAVSGNVTLIR